MVAREYDPLVPRRPLSARAPLAPASLSVALAAIGIACPAPRAATEVKHPPVAVSTAGKQLPAPLEWKRLLLGVDYRAVAGVGDDDVWLVGGIDTSKTPATTAAPPQPPVMHWNGQAWSRVLAPAGAPTLLEAVTIDDQRGVWIGGRGQIANLAPGATAWKTFTVLNTPKAWCCRQIARVGTEGWLAGPEVFFHHDATGIHLVTPVGWSNAVLGNAPDDVFRATTVNVYHWDGAAWQTLPRPPALELPAVVQVYAMWGRSGIGPWILISDGTVAQWTGTAWLSTSVAGERRCTAISGVGPADIWCAGESGLIAHFDGTSWSRIDPRLGTETLPTLTGIYATARHVWVVGGEVWRLDR